MTIQWRVEPPDCEAVRRFVEEHRNKSFVRHRIWRNVVGPAPQFSRQKFWKAMVGCLLTTQQRAGPGSAVTRFLGAAPFPLDLSVCLADPREERFLECLQSAGGIRRNRTIAHQLVANLSILETGGWQLIEELAQRLSKQRAREPIESDVGLERDAASALDEGLEGIGPKQSRNLWQDLGLTRYEIPLDSRITKWLKRMGFPIPLSANPLVDAPYYNFVLDGVQILCAEAKVLPCVLDGAIFASYDAEWDERTLEALARV